MNKPSFTYSQSSLVQIWIKTHSMPLCNSGCCKQGSDTGFVFTRIHSDKLLEDLHPMLLLAAALGWRQRNLAASNKFAWSSREVLRRETVELLSMTVPGASSDLRRCDDTDLVRILLELLIFTSVSLNSFHAAQSRYHGNTQVISARPPHPSVRTRALFPGCYLSRKQSSLMVAGIWRFSFSFPFSAAALV